MTRAPSSRSGWMALALLLAGAAALPSATPAGAQGLGILDNKSEGPIEIEADDGIEWRQDKQVYIARGNVKVVRGETTLYADTVTAYYREAKAKQGAPKQDETAKALGGGSEIWKIDAVGKVRIDSRTDRAYADRGVYNVDLGVFTLTSNVRLESPPQNTVVYGDDAVYDTNQAVMVLTGKGLRFDSPQTKITARDSLEYYDAKHMAVARGDAVALQEDKRLRADVLTAHMSDGTAGKPPPKKGADAKTGKAQPAKGKAAPARSTGGGGLMGDVGNGKVERIDAFGNVFMSSDQSIARAEKGVYTVASGMAILNGNVRITRGENQLNGDMAEVNLNTGVSRILSGPTASAPGQRVRALFAPAKAAEPAGTREQMSETKRAPAADDPTRPRLPPKPVQ
ncbi:MAG: hypothetical protein L6R19_15235 [Alphaproteobacteria bacterium]|nr:hypothetical protein [Alphaproteobacteria bacterium]